MSKVYYTARVPPDWVLKRLRTRYSYDANGVLYKEGIVAKTCYRSNGRFSRGTYENDTKTKFNLPVHHIIYYLYHGKWPRRDARP